MSTCSPSISCRAYCVCYNRTKSCSKKKGQKPIPTVSNWNNHTWFSSMFSHDTNSMQISCPSSAKLSRRKSAHAILGRDNSCSFSESSAFHPRPSNDHPSSTSSREDHHHPVFNTKYRREYNPCIGKYEITKVIRTVHKYADDQHDHIATAIRCAQKTAQVARAFSRETKMCGWTITVNIPKIIKVKSSRSTSSIPLRDICLQNDCGGRRMHTSEVRALEEHFLPKSETYLTNSGWFKDDNGTPTKLLLALAHYSYVWSSHDFMVGGMKASVDRRNKHIIISSPKLFSRQGGVFGSSDLGTNGIRNFFYWYRSNEFSYGLAKPEQRYFYFRPTPCTIIL